MSKILKGRGIEDIFHWVLLSVAFYFSYNFYSDMLLGLLITGLTFELLKPYLSVEAFEETNSKKKIVYLFFLIVIIGLSLLATCSSITNNYHELIKGGSKNVETKEWSQQKKKEELVKVEIERLKEEIKNYPGLKEYIDEVPGTHSTNRTKLTKQWQSGKDSLNENLKKTNEKYNSILDGYSSIKEFKVVASDETFKSYTKLFELISEKIGVKPDYIVIGISLILALLIEFGVLATKRIAVKARTKRLGTYKPNFEERLKEYQNNLLEQNFKSFVNDNSVWLEKTGSDNITVKEIYPKTKKNIGFNLQNYSKSSIKSMEENNNVVIKHDTKNQESTNLLGNNDVEVEDIKKYIKCMYENSKDDVSIGQSKIRNITGLDDQKIRNIRSYLNEKKIIQVDGRNTYILVDYKEALERCQL